MLDWWAQEWHKLAIALTVVTQWFIHWDEIVEKVAKLAGFKEYIERRIGDRRKKMANPIADIQLALTILGEVRTALPIMAKSIQDLKQAFADKSDPTKAATDLGNVLNDLEPLLNQVLALVPPAPGSTPTPAPTTPPPSTGAGA